MPADNQSPPERFDTFAGLPAALLFAVLLIGDFALAAFTTTMPSGERWAALTTFTLLALAYLLQGLAGLYDALGRIVRRDTRALAALVALLPALYISYSSAVDEFVWRGLATAVIFVALPTVALLRVRGVRDPTPLDFVAILYLWVSIDLGLVPEVPLPQQGGQVGFFFLGTVPLVLLLLAARGWSGLGFTWFLTWRDLLPALLASGVLLLVLIPLVPALGLLQPAMRSLPATTLLSQAITLYFLVALPQEIIFRGVIQNGIKRAAEAALRHDTGGLITRMLRPVLRHPRTLSLLLAALIFGAFSLNDAPTPEHAFLPAALTGLGYGWVYQRTGKVTASAVTHLLVIWVCRIFFGV